MRLPGAAWPVCALTVIALLSASLAVPAHAQPPAPRTNGPLAYVSTVSFALRTANIDGSQPRDVPGLPPRTFDPAWSPSGLRLAFASLDSGRPQIYLINSDGTGLEQLTHDPGEATDPTWSPDGQMLAFASTRNGNRDIYVIGVNGRGERRLTTDPASDQQPDWSPTGDSIAFESDRAGMFDIWLMAADGTTQRPVTMSESVPVSCLGFPRCFAPDNDADWSPDGTRLAFSSPRGPGAAILVADADGSGTTQLTSGNSLDEFPVWSPDGGQIAFTSDRGADPLVGESTSIWVMPSSRAAGGRAAREAIPAARDADWGGLPPPATNAVLGTTAANATPLSGEVSVTPPLGTVAAPLAGDARIPLGSTVHAKDGEVEVEANTTAAPSRGGAQPASATVADGSFELVRPPRKSTTSTLTLRLAGPRLTGCPRGPARAAVPADYNTRRVHVHSHHHVRGVTGDSRTDTLGTIWSLVQSCRGTLTLVRQGTVAVTDLHLHRTVRVTAGHSYFARSAPR